MKLSDVSKLQEFASLQAVAAQRKINCIGTGAEIEAPKALKKLEAEGVEQGHREFPF